MFIMLLSILLMYLGLYLKLNRKNKNKLSDKCNNSTNKEKTIGNKLILTNMSQLDIEYTDPQLQKEIEMRNDKIHRRNMMIWQVRKVHNINSYDDIVPKLIDYSREKDFESIVSLLDLLDKLHVNTEEILDEHPSIMKNCFSFVHPYSGQIIFN